MLTQADQSQIQQRGISIAHVNKQLEFFKKGIPYLNIVKPATPGDGILIPDESLVDELVSVYESEIHDKKILKFVPASGAATRMFKALFEFVAQVSEEPSGDAAVVIQRIRDYAFYNDLHEAFARQGLSLPDLFEKKSYKKIVETLLNEEGLNYGSLPKGLLKFHNYPDDTRTAIEEHLAEGAKYARNADDSVHIHFTVSPEHLSSFKKLVDEVKPMYEKRNGVTYHITFSVQKPSTDTIAADGLNNPFRDTNGELVFRPGGHGALLDNLADLDADVIFIKNIDNVVPDRLKKDTIQYKKVLGGLLLKLQKRVNGYLRLFDNEGHYREDLYDEVTDFIESDLGYRFPEDFSKADEPTKKKLLVSILNRPIRVCGMVKNTGEPGGGPFWVEDKNRAHSLQVLESSQFNMADEKQKQIFNQSTHFNPVDLVVSTRDYTGRKFDLEKFRDPDTGFISIKSKDGRELKALELPGLWNGSMAFWNTAFVEVPVSTFNPVKTINDLLRPEHQ